MRSSILIASVLGMFFGCAGAEAQGSALVSVEQVDAKTDSVRSGAGVSDDKNGEGTPGDLDGTVPEATSNAGLCRTSSLKGSDKALTECAPVARIDPRVTPEGTLLTLLGKNSWVTQRLEVRGASQNADVVAQDVARGDFRGTSAQAAVVALGQRPGPSPR